ncbi:hypothetical protein GF359_02580 [candidate division WOR-3 bacterium]|uniref:UspA domain-containing protein n=1 Tax=candidate division WOR-3 bacterium TaxID=2052148 RepID=A0A9D5QDI4_UNCW3|nr:hypothetical protein [candidate division WOR-3 bacterium]MBD3364080.1 hypothetical protein [candidate division WOR-3 bacterium]
MNDFSRILCPLDFSSASRNSLKTAEHLALKLSAELYVVNVVDPVPSIVAKALPRLGKTSSTSKGEANREPESQKDSRYLQEVIDEIRKKLDSEVEKTIGNAEKVNTIVTDGDPATAITKVARDEGIDMVVIGTRGEDESKSTLMGSVTEKVVRLSPIPVLTVRDGSENKNQEIS